MAYPRFQRSRAFKFATRTAGDLAITSTSFVDLDTGLDLALNAQVGDVILYMIAGLWERSTIAGRLEVYSLVSGAVVNGFSGATNGASCWYGTPDNVRVGVGAGIFYTLQASDIANGLVVMRLRGKVDTAGTHTLFANVNAPLQVSARNLGPVDPD